MATVSRSLTAGTTLTPGSGLPSSDLTTGSTADSNTQDLGAGVLPLWIEAEVTLTMGASASNFVFMGVTWSSDNFTFDPDVADVVKAFQTTASSDNSFRMRFPVRNRYFQFRFDNQSGGSIDFTTSNTQIQYFEESGDVA